jgi:uncharacterized membrane protein YphA (DoxX/SURF4 family)
LKSKSFIGIALLAVGIVFVFLGLQSSQGLDDQVLESITGEYTDSTIWYWLVGVVSAVIGLVLVLKR